jgi:hypothetical protein
MSRGVLLSGKKKQFFFEKKSQKTFARLKVHPACDVMA